LGNNFGIYPYIHSISGTRRPQFERKYNPVLIVFLPMCDHPEAAMDTRMRLFRASIRSLRQRRAPGPGSPPRGRSSDRRRTL